MKQIVILFFFLLFFSFFFFKFNRHSVLNTIKSSQSPSAKYTDMNFTELDYKQAPMKNVNLLWEVKSVTWRIVSKWYIKGTCGSLLSNRILTSQGHLRATKPVIGRMYISKLFSHAKPCSGQIYQIGKNTNFYKRKHAYTNIKHTFSIYLCFYYYYYYYYCFTDTKIHVYFRKPSRNWGVCRRLERSIFRVWPLNIALVKNKNGKQTTTKLDFSKQGSFNR